MLHLPESSIVHDLEWLTGFLFSLALEFNIAIMNELKVFRMIHYPIPNFELLLQGWVIGCNINHQEDPVGVIFGNSAVPTAPSKGMWNTGNGYILLRLPIIMVNGFLYQSATKRYFFNRKQSKIGKSIHHQKIFPFHSRPKSLRQAGLWFSQ